MNGVPEALAAATPTLRDVAARVGVSYASARAWRTGRLEWVLAGDFDLIGNEAPDLTEDQQRG